MTELRRLSLLFAVAAICGGGCAEFNRYNPWLRSHWAAEEEKFGPSFESRTAEVRELGKQARRMTPEEQKTQSEQLSSRLRNETSALMRMEIVRALGQFPTPEAATGLRDAMSDADRDVRITACRAWGARGGPEAAQVLARAVGSEADLDVRLAATRALGSTEGKQAVYGLSLALNDPDAAMQFRAAQSLKTVTGKDYGGDLTAWREYVRTLNPTQGEGVLAEAPGQAKPY